jgi:2-polyprenyl-6-methoxyphenol hydroxylase-like FAD-dependent oxidoreductase
MKILIAGAGIGGCALGWALQRKGFEVQIFERADEIKEVGAGLSLWSNATRILKLLDLDNVVENLSIGMSDGGIYSHTGELLARNVMKQMDERFGTPNLVAHRADLLDGLLNAVGREHVQTGAACLGASQTDTSVTLKLASGEEVSGDLLIGADGMRSTIRTAIGLPLELRYHGCFVLRGIVSLDATTLRPEDDFYGMYMGEGRHLGVTPMSGNRAYWFVTDAKPAGSKAGAEGSKAEMLARVARWPSAVRQIIEATPEERILRNDVYAQKPIDRWCIGRIGLLGDAAHAMTPNMGQGACQALEDAYVLAECLADAPESPAAALKRYQELRMKRAYRVVRESWWAGKLFNLKSGWACYLRNTLMKLRGDEKNLDRVAWVVGEQFERL